ncbi:DUF4433 domain-containing protein [Nocardia abscessus]|uniref:DarT ssDNA thymidine ADP-ribosyltransferase family protein n=1 Tax=Nocardia abscessus TaxID=120957 RepID=UPI0018931C83|nr:DarT ssDNA thymidine ADP-ribosyltransferase family protein [Nocardia abscessus]MBF6340667.1 DUF4433 domain-containing protein [Nocardia abscessus]
MTPIDLAVLEELRGMSLSRLTHFTPARNLPHIIKDGKLRGAAELRQDVRACFTETDLARLDGYPHMICSSLQYPNAFYLAIAQAKPNALSYPDWVCLLLNKEVAALEGTLFCPRNAAAGGVESGVAGLRGCYAPSVLGQGNRVRSRGPRHDPGSPTDVQAEVLLPAPISLSQVHAIVFPTVAAAREERGRLRRFGIPLPSIPWRISPQMFNRQAVTAAVTCSEYFEELAWTPGGVNTVDIRSNP